MTPEYFWPVMIVTLVMAILLLPIALSMIVLLVAISNRLKQVQDALNLTKKTRLGDQQSS
jgi:uncharacterized protein YoxC